MKKENMRIGNFNIETDTNDANKSIHPKVDNYNKSPNLVEDLKNEKVIEHQEVITINGGEKYELIFSEIIMPLGKNDNIIITLKRAENWKFEFIFTDDFTKPQYDIDQKIIGGIVTIKLNKWLSSSWVELTEPIFFHNSSLTTKIKIQFRTTLGETNKQRVFFINAWKTIT